MELSHQKHDKTSLLDVSTRKGTKYIQVTAHIQVAGMF